jgi:hypothetical protein
MTAVRRTLTLILLTLTAVIAGSVSASATFSDADSLAPTVATGSVAAPASMSISDYCSTTSSSYWNGFTTVSTTSYWYNATVSWPASTTANGVSGYRVVAHLNDGTSVVMGETDAFTRTVSARVDRSNLGYQPRISILTLTSYGWTAESAQSAVLTC